jgi:ligand-binding sensor domain-containing protein
MTNSNDKKTFFYRNLILILLILQCSSCTGQVKEKSAKDSIENQVNTPPIITKRKPLFPQIHTNLDGMVSQFVRKMHQDKKGHYWFGTNGDGIIRYDGNMLEKIAIEGIHPNMRVLEIIEDKAGHLWFGTSDGLIQYDGEQFFTFSKKEGLQGDDVEIWDLMIDKNGLMWVGSMEGVCHFDGEKFTPFALPKSKVINPEPILSIKRISGFLEDNDGNIWISNDGNGIYKYKNGAFTQLTTENGLIDDNSAAALLDKKGNVWISSYYGGASKFDGNTFTNFTKEGVIEGIETASFFEDSKGNIWFTVENIGVYKYDGSKFTLFTTENGLTTNGVQCIFEDYKGQLWLSTWQGLCIFDGEKFVNAKDKEPWTN